MKDEINSILDELFELIGVKAKIEIAKEEEGYLVSLSECSEAGLLIGSHGATLNAIQSFLVLALKQKTGEWQRISLDIDGWKQKQEDYLRDLAQQAADRARGTKQAQHLYNLTPAQRRVIHMALKDEGDLVTQSQGEGDARYLVVSLVSA